MTLEEWYEVFLGSRAKSGALFIPDFGEDESLYEDLLDDVLAALSEYGVIKMDYFQWLYERAVYRFRHLQAQRKKYEFYDPLLHKNPQEYTTREQLTLIKHYLMRRKYNKFIS